MDSSEAPEKAATTAAPAIGRMQVPKASDLLAARVREQILSGAFSEGRPLPNERDLAVETGLGRGTIREAFRILENQGLITIRTGRNGGAVVRRPGRSSVEESIDTFIRGQQLRLEALLEARAAVEPAAARYAAIHRTDDDLDRLQAIQRELEKAVAGRDLPRYLRANVDWHLAVVQASHNELLIAFMTAIGEAVHAATEVDNFNSDEVRRATLHAHHRIIEAIVARDAEAAGRRMARHVDAYVALIGEKAPARKTGKRKAKRK